mgnify:CR=1 FL=1
MLFLYNIIVFLASQIVGVLALFSPKMKLFVNGRKEVFTTLQSKINSNDKTIWFHAASLGEYEQGIPVIEKIKTKFPFHKIIVTFFSPSGFEVRKNNTVADVTVYLPLDTRSNAKKFIDLVHPDMVFFIKYEYWPNYLNELKKLNIKTYLISGVFRETQVFFKWYGGFYREILKQVRFFFVQNESSKNLLNNIGINQVLVTGDTRFDRVAANAAKQHQNTIIEQFVKGNDILLAGSTWSPDEKIIASLLNNSNFKFIIAPHEIKESRLQEIEATFNNVCIRYSQANVITIAAAKVLIIDNIGMLSSLYQYASIAYIGGGFGVGIHNTLEAAAFGKPVIF